jgi:fumarylacetoacetase
MTLKSFLNIPSGSDFSIHNLPYGVFKPNGGGAPRVGVASGEYVLDLRVLHDAGFFKETSFAASNVFAQRSLNAFMKLGRDAWRAARAIVQNLLREDVGTLRDSAMLRYAALVPHAQAEMLLPVEIGDYTDFYSSYHHAHNVGTMLRGADNALMPNWKHLPVAYHGRASSVVVSGTNFRRPFGQIKPADATAPLYAPAQSLDFELEMGFFVGAENALGEPIRIDRADEFMFGMVLVNDWSARDVQAWEYQPLGPFLAKNFCTSISPWVVPFAALEPFKSPLSAQEPKPLAYLTRRDDWTYDIELQVSLQSEKMPLPYVITQSNFRNLYWSMNQQLAHHTVNGCNVRVGDLVASGTISGAEPQSRGSLLELTWRGKEPLRFPNGDLRRFLEDGDMVTMRAWGKRDEICVGFGEVCGKVLPAKDRV